MRGVLVVCIVLAACSGTEVAETGWVEHERMTVARSEHPAVVVDDEIVVAGGLIETAPGRFGVTATVEAYDPINDSWRSLPDLPAPRHHMMAAVVDDRLFAIGGFSAAGFGEVATVWELIDGSWVDRAPLPLGIGAGAAVTLDDHIYVVGGAPAGGLFRYSPDDDVWDELTPPSQQREHVAAVVFEGEIWALAGRWPGQFFDSVEIYDPETDTWEEGPPMAEARSGFGATVAGDVIVVAGGEVFGPDEALVSVERYDGGAWVSGEPLPTGLHGIPLVSYEDRLYVPGGSTRPGGVVNPGTMLSYPIGR